MWMGVGDSGPMLPGRQQQASYFGPTTRSGLPSFCVHYPYTGIANSLFLRNATLRNHVEVLQTTLHISQACTYIRLAHLLPGGLLQSSIAVIYYMYPYINGYCY